MSETTSTPSQASGNGTRVAIATWAPLGVSVLNISIFGLVALFAYIRNDETSIAIIVGAAITMAKDATAFWFSSTSSSRAKDDRQADLVQQQTTALASSAPTINQGTPK